MAPNDSSENKNMGLSQNQIYGILGVLAALLIVLAIVWNVRSDDDSNVTDSTTSQNETNNNGQTAGESKDGSETENSDTVSGNISSSGVLRVSDEPIRGNYVLDGEDGEIYVSTGRDYSALVGKNVFLEAEGTLNKFAFLDFTDTAIVEDAGDVGGAAEEVGDVAFTGKLENSSSSRGNYTITSGNTVVYLQSVRDYSAWVGSNVNLSATGSLNSFTNAVLSK